MIESFRNNLKENLKDYPQIELSSVQMDLFFEYYKLLQKWNKVHNLTAVIDPWETVRDHFVDCIIALHSCRSQFETNPIYDLGSGNGFPGVVLAILFPDQEVILVESSRKKTSFLRTATSSLKLDNVVVKNCRAQELANIEIAITRAAFSEPNLVSIGQIFKKNGKFILLTVPSFPSPVWFSSQSIYEVKKRFAYSLENGAHREVVVLNVTIK